MTGVNVGATGRSTALVLCGARRPKMRQQAKRDWTEAKQRDFLTALAETCNVSRAAQEAGVSVSSAYRRRKTNAAFRAGWLEAIGTAYQRLELVLLDRAFNGTEKLVKRRDGSEERMKEYSNQLGLTLLKMHRDTAVEAAPENEPENIDEIRERVFNKLERLRIREERARGASE
ncbi:MAG: hypothetical protein M3448_08285 [Pseudomonadota bacterium]|nr:hypothetical protein [Pseudomonadota bacterium]